jgi:hypothetical protein
MSIAKSSMSPGIEIARLRSSPNEALIEGLIERFIGPGIRGAGNVP